MLVIKERGGAILGRVVWPFSFFFFPLLFF